MIEYSTNKMPIIIFESLIKQISKGSCYDLTNMQVQRYLDKRILKTTVTSKVSSNNGIEVTASDDDDGDDDDDDDDDDDAYVSPDETKIVAKVLALDLKALVQTYLWSNCNVSVSTKNRPAWCNIIVITFQHNVHVNLKHIWD